MNGRRHQNNSGAGTEKQGLLQFFSSPRFASRRSQSATRALLLTLGSILELYKEAINPSDGLQ